MSEYIQVERVQALLPDRFIDAYLGCNRPVIVTDAMSQWSALRNWTPAYFRRRFGDEIVQIYDDLFFMVSTRPLKDYIDRFITGPRTAGKAGAKAPYVRWYSRQDAREDFPWSDSVFARLQDEWSRPYFMPERGMYLPFAKGEEVRDPVSAQFPARGIFISAQGARTRLHVDPWASDALLCQVNGVKRFLLFPPNAVPMLTHDGALVDIRYDAGTDDWVELPVRPYADDCLHPGEIIFIPAGWAHTFQSTNPSISITWNFVHRTNAARLADYVETGVPQSEARSFAYFFGAAGMAELLGEKQERDYRGADGSPDTSGTPPPSP